MEHLLEANKVSGFVGVFSDAHLFVKLTPVMLLFVSILRPTMGEYAAGRPYQKLIHFPKTGILCTKDNLARLIKRNRGWFGKIYHFTPVTYVLPNETKQFVDLFTRQAVSANQKQQMWICKPTDLSRGRKISIINNL